MTDTLGNLEIRRTSAVGEMGGALRERIVAGLIPPGTRLGENRLAAAAGVSRNTAREAIRSLVPSRLVRHDANRGFAVAQLDEADVRDIFRARRTLELAAVDTARSGIAGAMEGLDTALNRLERAAQRRNWGAIFDADMAFHLAIVRSAGSSRLDAFFTDLMNELRLALIDLDRTTDDPPALVSDHRELLDVLRSGSRAQRSRSLARHLERSESEIIAHLKRKQEC